MYYKSKYGKTGWSNDPVNIVQGNYDNFFLYILRFPIVKWMIVILLNRNLSLR